LVTLAERATTQAVHNSSSPIYLLGTKMNI
jgi:hypothetical protein